MNLKLEVTVEEGNLITTALGKLPFESVFALIQKLQAQAAPQLNPPPQEPAEPVSAT